MKKQIIDQSAHIAAAITLLTPVLLWPDPIGAALSGLGAGIVREITEPDSPFSGGSLLDLTFWAIGGGIAGLLLHGNGVSS